MKTARQNVARTVNQTMVYTYYEIGQMIVEEEQHGEQRAAYGKQLLKELSKKLTAEFGKGFSERNLEQMRQLYLIYPISQTISAKFTLSWSHYLKLIRIKNPDERRFYEIECSTNNWTLKELQRQFDATLYERLSLSRDKEGIKQLAEKGQIIENPTDLLKDPYILEFLDLPEKHQYSESDLESAIIDKLEHFLLELGKGFTFVARQFRMTIDEKHFKADLVFFNRLLRCFVIIDLKIGELTHQDLGQMQMYVHYHDRFVKLPDENKTIGIILCKQRSKVLVEITLPENNDQIFASQYQTVLPDKQTFINLLNDSEI
ncbi:MAG TPA: PDDEXK nuclease domain-containing protein [Chitinophagales bacterium]|nr:PDDEXK nuclease domain-containing protein [Chitinophagales bacterium]